MATLGVLAQSIEPALTRGEDATVIISGSTFDTDPTDWAVQLEIWRDPSDEATPLVIGDDVGEVTPDVTGPDDDGLYTVSWTAAIPAASSADCDPGVNTFRVRRTDTGFVEVLAAGTWLVL